MSRLKAFNLTKHQASVLKKAYGEGELDTRVMFNLLGQMPSTPVRGLEHLPVPQMDPVHFRFTGNRDYDMQVVSNGEVCAILTHQRMSKKEREGATLNVVRMEVIDSTHLPFLKVATPTDMQVRQLYADLLEWVVEQFGKLQGKWTPEQLEVGKQFARGMGKDDFSPESARILAGEDPREVLAGWIQGPALEPTRRSARM